MEFLQKEDELLIQNMVEGTLSAEGIKKFEQLINSSPTAHKFYNDLLKVDTLLSVDAKNIKPIDFSNKIMHRVKSIQTNLKSTKQKKNSRVLSSKFRFIYYAAILVVGLVTGVLATFILVPQKSIIGNHTITGTLAAKQTDKLYYQKNNTEINVHEFETEQLKFAIISIKTKEEMQCLISEETGMSDKNIILLSSDGKFKKLKTDNNIKYEFAGEVVFQTYQTKPNETVNPVEIQFIKNGEKIKTIHLN